MNGHGHVLIKKRAADCSQPTLALDGHALSSKSISSQDYYETSWHAWKVFQILTVLLSSFPDLGSMDLVSRNFSFLICKMGVIAVLKYCDN